jgi:hypothetical protein
MCIIIICAICPSIGSRHNNHFPSTELYRGGSQYLWFLINMKQCVRIMHKTSLIPKTAICYSDANRPIKEARTHLDTPYLTLPYLTLPSLRTQATIAPQPGQTAQTVIVHPTPFLPPDRQGRAREWEWTSPEPQAPRSIDHPAMPGPFPLHRLRIARLWKGGGWGRVIFWTQQAA